MLVTLAVVFSMQVFSAIVYLNTSVPRLIAMRAVFYRENASRFYVPEVYALVTAVKELPFVVFFSLVFVSIAYFMVGLKPTAEAFFTFWLADAVLIGIFHVIATAFAAFVPDDQAGQILGAWTRGRGLGGGRAAPSAPPALHPAPGGKRAGGNRESAAARVRHSLPRPRTHAANAGGVSITFMNLFSGVVTIVSQLPVSDA